MAVGIELPCSALAWLPTPLEVLEDPSLSNVALSPVVGWEKGHSATLCWKVKQQKQWQAKALTVAAFRTTLKRILFCTLKVKWRAAHLQWKKIPYTRIAGQRNFLPSLLMNYL